MGIGFKIRALLLLLGIGCIITALSINQSLTPRDLLNKEAEILQENVRKKEIEVNNFISNKVKLKQATSFHKDAEAALAFIKTYRVNGINIFTFNGTDLQFWSTIKTLPPKLESIREGRSFLQLDNGYYESVRYTQGNFTIIFLITIKNQYTIQNQYLKNEIITDLSPAGFMDIANFNDPNDQVRNINGLEGRFLFSVKLTPYQTAKVYDDLEIWFWLAGIIFVCMFVNSFCSWLAKRGFLVAATLILGSFFISLRLSDLEFGWINHQFDLDIFDPKIYAESFFLPSLGDLLLNALALTWFMLFVYTHRKKYVLPAFLGRYKWLAVATHLLALAIFGAFAYFIDDIFFGLIYNSRIAFDINILNLDWISWICVLLICLAWFNIYLIAVSFIKFTIKLPITNNSRLWLFLACISAFTLYKLMDDYTAFYLILGLLVFLLAYNVYVQNRRFSISVFAASFFCMALITSVKYIKFTDIRERGLRASVAQRLETADDLALVNAVDIFERSVNEDKVILSHFNRIGGSRDQLLQNHIEKRYLDGFVANFELNIYTYNRADLAIGSKDAVPLKQFRDLVISGALKTPESKYFYRINDTFGYQNYFGMIPIFNRSSIVGTIVIELRSQPYDYNLRFPDLLLDGKAKRESDYNDYSFAFYNDNRLVNQSGKFTYSLLNKEYKAPVGKAVSFNDAQGEFNHLVYSPTSSKVIVISKERIAYVTRLAALSFFFLFFILFSLFVSLLIWLLKNLESSAFGWFSLNKYLMINANQILYKTRIQFSIILVVVATLLVVGWATFFYISEEYRVQQSDQIRDKIRKIQSSYENKLLVSGLQVNEEAAVDFDQFADLNGAYLNLYNTRGDLLLTSIPKIYESGILERKMGPQAYIYLDRLQSSEYINSAERIGDFQYAAAYVPIRNVKNQTIAYLGSPFYSNEEDYDAKIDLFINTLINIYALVFVVIGVLAVFLANQITNPLTFIQESIRQTKLGRRNQPIQWSRHDEIGLLIKEYNKMIAALEISATKLARSEREHAWREMAKQVAHEIKNPLTPLKLGVQLLERSWKEQDPNFERKFENFNRSFIEQIDSLARIASEFSNFAKMPDTKLENIELLPVIQQATEVYKHSENAEIHVVSKMDKDPVILGDKDQLLRTFNNLFKNAIEATEEGNNTAIKIVIYKRHDNVVVSVEDNGRGIGKEQKDQIFAPNFTTKSSGTGLGLAFVKQAVENAGGEVSFDSEVGLGTTFYLSFPVV